MKWFDDFFEKQSRRVAQSASRRSAVARLGKLMLGSAVLLPVLPFDRVAKAASGLMRSR